MPLELKNVTHIYSPGTPFEKRALYDINLCIADGEFVGIIGHTGSGKSTLIQHMNALMQPTSGSVWVDGVNINDAQNRIAVRRKVGLVFQYPEYQLFEETVFKDVCFGPSNMGLTAEETAKSAREALRTVGLGEDTWEKSPFELSGGQKRRCAVAGVLAMKPEVLILDEPAAGLDPVGRKEILAIIQQIHAGGTTVIMVSHSMDDVARLCERIIVLDNGRIALDGTPAEVFSDTERINKLGLSLPQAAQLKNRLNQLGFVISDEVFTIEALAEALLKQLKR